MKILLLSHGFLANEMKQTASMILGDFAHVTTLSLEEGADIVAYEEKIKSQLDECDEMLVLVDLLGGTPFMTCAKIYRSLDDCDKSKFRVVTGMNLAMVLEVINNIDGSNLQELTNIATSIGQKGVVNVFEQLEEGDKS
ncbi:MAG: PTS sugar transporter subunit IIA [Erysipelotrichaceae bacterium]